MASGQDIYRMTGIEYDASEKDIVSRSPNRIVFITSSNCPACHSVEPTLTNAVTLGKFGKADLYVVQINPPLTWVGEMFRTNAVQKVRKFSGIPATAIYRDGVRWKMIEGKAEHKMEIENANGAL